MTDFGFDAGDDTARNEVRDIAGADVETRESSQYGFETYYDYDNDGTADAWTADTDRRIDMMGRDNDDNGVMDEFWVDDDGDGRFEYHYRDLDGNGRLEYAATDADDDGNPESVSRDTDGDGYGDRVEYDDDDNGTVDRVEIDRDADGQIDTVYRPSDQISDHVTRIP